jgi:hypothetical protein
LAIKVHIQVLSSELEVKIEESGTGTQEIIRELTRQRESIHEIEQAMNKLKLETEDQVDQLKAEIAALKVKVQDQETSSGATATAEPRNRERLETRFIPLCQPCVGIPIRVTTCVIVTMTRLPLTAPVAVNRVMVMSAWELG